MELTQEEKTLVTTTFYQIMPISDKAAKSFYDRLFEIEPKIAPMFDGSNMMDLRKKLMDMIALVIHSVDDFSKVEKAMRSLGARHSTYGVAIEHYEPVGEALLWAFATELGDGWTDEVESAWQKTYQIMQDMATSDVYDS